MLDAAATVIAREGLDVSMEAVAEQAGVTRMTVYRLLGPRDQVLVSVLLDQSAAVVEQLRAVLEDPARPFAERVVDVIVVIVVAVRTSPVLTFFVQGITPTQIDHLDAEDRFMERVWALLLPYFEEAARRGELRAAPAATLDWTLRQILVQLVVQGVATGTVEGLREDLQVFFVPSIAAGDSYRGPASAGGRRGTEPAGDVPSSPMTSFPVR